MKSLTANEIKALFPFPRFDPIAGIPTYNSLWKLEIQAIRNTATVEISLPPPHKNLSGLVEQQQMYLLRTGGPFPRPAYPGHSPVFPNGTTVAQRQTIQ